MGHRMTSVNVVKKNRSKLVEQNSLDADPWWKLRLRSVKILPFFSGRKDFIPYQDGKMSSLPKLPIFEPRSAIVQGVVYPEADVGGVKQRGRERGWASTAEAKANTKNGAKVGSWEHENF